MVRLAASDWQRMLDVVAVAAENDSPDPFPAQVLERLRDLVPCDVVSYGEYDPERRGWRRAPRWVGEPHAPVTDSIREAFHALRDQYPHRPTDSSALLRWSDRIPRRARRRSALYCEVDRPLGCEYDLTLWLKDGHTALGHFSFDRFRSDFSDRDLRVLELIHPYLLRFARQAAQRWPEPANVLTTREREILAWVARGKANNEIATILWLSPGTVRKHLDHIYEKLDVPNRTAAVSRAYHVTTPPETNT